MLTSWVHHQTNTERKRCAWQRGIHYFQEEYRCLSEVSSRPYGLARKLLEKCSVWTDYSKIELFGFNEKHYVWRKPSTAFQNKNHSPTMKHGGGSIMVCGCLLHLCSGWLAIIDGPMKCGFYRRWSVSWSLTISGSPSKTMTLSTWVVLRRNG